VRLTRRDALAGVGGAVVAGVTARVAEVARSDGPETQRAFDGVRQAGIVTPRQSHLTMAAFDLVTPDRADVLRLLRAWTELLVALCEGEVVGDTGERAGLGPCGLTVTVGLGTGLFDRRYGFHDRCPLGLPRSGFPGDGRLDPRLGGGDLLVQVCADDRQVVFHAVHQLANAALGIAGRRWTQHGFLSRSEPGATPRNVSGFMDGTANPSVAEAERHVWAAEDRDGMVGGTYLVYRRIRMRLQAWDRSPVAEQERTIGRRKVSGAPAVASPRSHVRAMHPDRNGGVRLLRRSYSYDDGQTANGETDAGLAFICFVADPARQFGRLQARLERDDDLRRYVVDTAGGVFAIPPAPGQGEYLGQRLLA
jgi:deferrochelatase/peroxidase EfeB